MFIKKRVISFLVTKNSNYLYDFNVSSFKLLRIVSDVEMVHVKFKKKSSACFNTAASLSGKLIVSSDLNQSLKLPKIYFK